MNSYGRFFENLQQDLKVFIYWCLVFTVFRIAFIAIYSGQLNGDYSDIPMALLLGLRLSLKTAGMIALIGFVFATLPKIILKNWPADKLRFSWHALALVFFAVCFMTRIPYYKIFNAAFNMMLINGAHDDIYAIFVTAVNTMENLSNSNKDASSNLNDDLKSVNNNLKALSNTMVNFADSLTNEKPTFEDVSLKSSEDIVEGKLTKCSNKGSVSGDINVGGIAGAVAKENDLDPEDDFSITGQTSLNMTYKVRAVLIDSVNEGTIFLKKNNAGGIVGNQDLGLIKNNINYGLLDCEDGSYIGGIVGLSLANVNNNYAKCFIYGSDYVGGIAGRGKKLNNNGSLAQIKEATNNVGMIMGGLVGDELAENSEDINGNYYLYGGYGAIDNISYGGKAYPISYDELKNLDIVDDLKKINIYFVNDKECILKETIEYGDSLPLSKVPYIDEKDNDYALWDGLSDGVLNNVTRDLLFKCDFNDVYPSISSSEEPLAYVVADGKFFMSDSLSCMVEAKDKNEITYKLNFKLGNNSLCDDLRIYTNSYDKYEVYVNGEKVDYTEDGRYCVIAYDNKVDSITVKKLNDYSYLLYCALGGVAVVIVTLGIVRRKHKKKK